MPRHDFLLREFKIALDQIPSVVPESERKQWEERYRVLEDNPDVSEEMISVAMSDFGKQVWPYRKAIEAFRIRYGNESQEKYVLEHLAASLQKKYTAFRGERSTETAVRDAAFEDAFTPEEKYQIGEAFLDARRQVREDVQALIRSEKQDEFREELQAWQEKQARLNGLIQELRALADRSEKWAPEILEKVRVIEEGWSVVERDVDEELMKGEIAYYRDLIEGGL